MQLINRTPLSAEINLSDGLYETSQRYLMVSAKATFRFDALGRVELDRESLSALRRRHADAARHDANWGSGGGTAKQGGTGDPVMTHGTVHGETTAER